MPKSSKSRWPRRKPPDKIRSRLGTHLSGEKKICAEGERAISEGKLRIYGIYVYGIYDGEKLTYFLSTNSKFSPCTRKRAPASFSVNSSFRPRCSSFLAAEGDKCNWRDTSRPLIPSLIREWSLRFKYSCKLKFQLSICKVAKLLFPIVYSFQDDRLRTGQQDFDPMLILSPIGAGRRPV